MMLLPTVPSYTDVHNRWIQYHEEQLDIVAHSIKSWAHSLDRATWSFFHNQIDNIVETANSGFNKSKSIVQSYKIK